MRREASRVINSLHEGSDVVYITQYGRPTAVLVDYAKYEILLAEIETLKQNQVSPVTAIATPKSALAAPADMAQDLGVDDLAGQHGHYLYGVDKS